MAIKKRSKTKIAKKTVSRPRFKINFGFMIGLAAGLTIVMAGFFVYSRLSTSEKIPPTNSLAGCQNNCRTKKGSCLMQCGTGDTGCNDRCDNGYKICSMRCYPR